MSATEIATRHFSAAIAEAQTAGLGHDSVCRSLLSLVVSKYLENREVADVAGVRADGVRGDVAQGAVVVDIGQGPDDDVGPG